MTAGTKRTAGILIPLFSIRTEKGWGIGEFPDIGAIAPWLRQGNFSLLMMLPLLEASLGQDSPYSALSAFALDPAYISLESVEDFHALGGEGALSDGERRELEAARASARVDYGLVRRLKERWLRRAHEQFVASGAADGSQRARDFARFRDQHADWLMDYSLFRAIKDADRSSWWRAWAPELQKREQRALADARAFHARTVAFYDYVQWLAYSQLAEARRVARSHGVQLAGDLPFMVAEDSVDAWAQQDEFTLEASVGTPPDAFSVQGQDWGLPVYRWDVMAPKGYSWLRRRGARTAEAFDIVRVDHVVGFYRTYVRPKDKSQAYFSPAEEPDQVKQGEAVMAALGAGGVRLIAEDLGVVPPFVRQSLTRLGIPGFRVLRWEKDDAVFRDPEKWPAQSVGTTGTHDTEPIATWWKALPNDERTAIRQIRALSALSDAEAAEFSPAVHRALLEATYGSGSDLVLFPGQDVFGTTDRINVPGTVGAENWSYRLPLTIGQLGNDAETRAKMQAAAEMARKSGRA